MINHNILFEDVLNRTMSVKLADTDYSANFMEGDLFELWRVLQKSEQKYPIIWLQSGYKVTKNTINGSRITFDRLDFFLITKGDTNDYNEKRYRTTFNDMLYVLEVLLVDTFKKAKGFTLPEDYESSSFPFNEINEPSTSGMKLKPQTATTPVIWDAVALSFDGLSIVSDCYPEYKIK